MSDRPRFLLDTEVLLRAFRSDGPARELLQRGMLRDLSLVTSSSILDELDEVLARPKFGISSDDRQTIREVLLRAADEVAIFDEQDVPRHVAADPGDDHVVEAAIRTDAQVLVTFDDAITALTSTALRVLTDGAACAAFRGGLPYGSHRLLTPEERDTLRTSLTTAGGTPRRGAYDHLVAATEHLPLEHAEDGYSWVALPPGEACGLIADLVEACGPGLLLDLRDGGSYDYLSGTRYDVPPRGAAPALDILWYSSDRAAAASIADPGAPTISDFGWPDDHRHRVVVAGAVLIVVPVQGPDGEPDVRGLFPVAEPLAVPPEIANEYRISTSGRAGEDATILSMDPAGFTSSTWVWLAGGPCSFMAPMALPRDGLQRIFLAADTAAARAGFPTPRPEVLEELLPRRLHALIVR